MHQLKQQTEDNIRSYIQGCNHGYFVTMDTHYTRLSHRIDNNFLTNFVGETESIFNALNLYAFGRNFQRYKVMKKRGIPITTEHKLKVVTAYEIGEGGRFHFHSMLLHDGSCKRTTKEINNRLKKICSYNPHTKLTGESAMHVEPYDAALINKWIPYFLKSTNYFKDSIDFYNIVVM
jgi:hypothetical protein